MFELDRIELGERPALAIQYSADVQYRMWRLGYDWRPPYYPYVRAGGGRGGSVYLKRITE